MASEDSEWARRTREESCSSGDSLGHGRKRAIGGNAAEMAVQFSDELKRRAEEDDAEKEIVEKEYRIV